MLNIRDLYIQGDYIDTPVGKCYFIKVKEYPELVYYKRFFEIQKDKIVMEAKKDNPDYADILEKMELVQIIKHDPKFRDMFNDFFMFFFKDEFVEVEDEDGNAVKKPKDFMSDIKSDKDLESILDLFKEMNCIHIEKENPNPEIEKFNKLRRKIQEAKGEGITYESMYTSIWLESNSDPRDLTLYQFYKLFDRISQFKKYDTSTLMATVAKDVKIESWYKEIEHDDGKPEQQIISEDKFNSIKNKKSTSVSELIDDK